MNDVRSTGQELLLPAVVLTGFLRIVTNPRVIRNAPSTAEATSFVAALRSGRGALDVSDDASIGRCFGKIVDGDDQIGGNLVPDAFLAAVAISHGATLATRDRGFARSPGLRRFDPAAG